MSQVYIADVKTDSSDFEKAFDKIILPLLKKEIKTVVIKPNFLNELNSKLGVTTDIELLKKLIVLLKKHKIPKVIIAEASFANTEQVFQKLEVYELEKYGAKIINLEKDTYVKVSPPFKLTYQSFLLPKTILEADLIISAAKMKTHSQTVLSLSIKNFYGILPRLYRHTGHIISITNSIADLYSYLYKHKKMVSVIDGIVAMEGPEGPSAGRPKQMGLVIFGDDPLAADTIAAKIMGCPLSHVKHLTLIKQKKLGSVSSIEMHGKRLSDVQVKFDLPSPISILFIDSLIPVVARVFRKRPYLKHKGKCTHCMLCLNNCPKQAIFLNKNNEISFDYSKCISCLVCCEACTSKALSYKLPFLQSLIYPPAKRIYRFIFKR